MEEEKKTITIKVPSITLPNKWILSTLILLVLLVISIIGWPIDFRSLTGRAVEVEVTYLTPEEAKDKVIDYINNNLVRPGTEATALSVEEVYGVYKIMTSYQGQEIPVYVTKDGSMLFLAGYDLTKEVPSREAQPPQQAFDAPDREKPNVKFFVMSFCPFGNQAEDGLRPVFDLLGDDKVEWEPHYVIYSNYATGYPDYCLDEENKYCSMHGIQELNQDVRELCVWKYYDHSTWWDFVLKVNEQCNSRNAETCWEPIAEEVGIDTGKIKTCQDTEALDLLAAEVKLNQQYGVRGSPTIFINDQRYSGGRSPEAFKQAICSGFITQPEECQQTLSTSGTPATGGCK